MNTDAFLAGLALGYFVGLLGPVLLEYLLENL